MNMKRTFAVITAAVMLFSFSPAVFGEELISFSVEKETPPLLSEQAPRHDMIQQHPLMFSSKGVFYNCSTVKINSEI